MPRPRKPLLSLFVSTVTVVVACAKANDSDLVGNGPEQGGGTAGSSGKGGSAGTSLGGSGGTGAQAGKGGTGGSTAGSGGKGGSSTGGSGGKGSGGSAGMTALGCELGEGGAAGAAGGASGGEGGGGGESSAARVVFFDDFESGNDDRWSTEEGAWSVVTDGGEVYEQSLTDNSPQFSMASGTCFADQIVEARVKILDFPGSSTSYHVALFARALGPTTHYFVALDSTGKISLRKRVNGSGNSSDRLGSDKALSPRVDDGEWHDLRLEVVGTTLTAFVDGNQELTATDGSIASGGVAVGTLNATAEFDDVRITTP